MRKGGCRGTLWFTHDPMNTVVPSTNEARVKWQCAKERNSKFLCCGTSSTFFENLSASIPDGASRLELLRFFTEQNTLTEQTKHLSDGDATLFLTPQDVNLKMKMSQAT